MTGFKNPQNKKEQNFDVNILPTLDILSVLICFLLLTAIWVQMGYIPTQQMVETSSQQTQGEGEKKLELHIAFEGRSVQFNIEGGNQPFSRRMNSSASISEVSSLIEQLKNRFPDLKLAKIFPQVQTEYGLVVIYMNELRKNKITDLGLVPAGS